MFEIGDYRVYRLDKRNWTVEKKAVYAKGDKEGETYWPSGKYYPTLNLCMIYVFDQLLEEEDAWSIRKIMICIYKAEQKIEKAIRQGSC